MPNEPEYPGVYFEEVSASVGPIRGVPTSITAFIGRARRGPMEVPTLVRSFGGFEERFGSLWSACPLGYAVHQFFENGGSEALIVRVGRGTARASFALPAGTEALILEAVDEGAWGNRLEATVGHDPSSDGDGSLFFLRVVLTDERGGPPIVEEFPGVAVEPEHPRFVGAVLEERSILVRVKGPLPAQRPDPSRDDPTGDPVPAASLEVGDDGLEITAAQLSDPELEASMRGLWALDRADLFNILCIPPLARHVDVDTATWDAAGAYCARRRAVLIVDPPASWRSPDDVDQGVELFVTRRPNSILYFPRVRIADPLEADRVDSFAPSGVMAGLMARNDSKRGVWKAPAGLEATLRGVIGLECDMTGREYARLNGLGVNCLRTFPPHGPTCWGARTLAGVDGSPNEGKYVSLRRLALFIEESLFRGTRWAVFQPNDHRLWARVRLAVENFMAGLFRAGALIGDTAREAFFVRCDAETNSAADIERGVLTFDVGFAALQRAEYAVVRIRQAACSDDG